MRLARTAEEVAVIRRLVDDQRAQELHLDFLDSTEAVREREPALAETVLAASLCPTDGSANPVAAVEAFAAAAERLSCRMRLGETVTGLEITQARLAAVVTDKGQIATAHVAVACGAFGNTFLAELRLEVPLRQPMVTVMQTEPMPPLLGPVLGVANANMAGRQQRNDQLLVTSGAGNWDGVLTTAVPATRLASGHSFGIGPVTGQIIADLVQGEPAPSDLQPFRFARFNSTGEPEAGLTLHG